MNISPTQKAANKASEALDKAIASMKPNKHLGYELAKKELEKAKAHIYRKYKEMVFFMVRNEDKSINEAIIEAAPLFVASAKSFN